LYIIDRLLEEGAW